MAPSSPISRLEQAAESVVVAMAVAGSGAAFTELMRRRQYGVRRFMRQLCGNQDLADDLAQQVFLRAWRSIRAVKSPESFNGWLKRVMVSVWVDETRRLRSVAPAISQAADDIEPGTQSPQGLELDSEWALSVLDSRTRLCVLLAYSEGHSHSEIAELLDIPLGTAKSLVSRGAEKMRGLLKAYIEVNSSCGSDYE